MPTMRPAAAWLRGVCAAALFAAASSTADAQQGDRYPATLQFGTGLVTIPVAWVSPSSTDAWLNTSGRYTPTFPDTPVEQGFASLWNTNIALDVHLLQRVSIGVAAYDQNIDYGFFGQVLLLRDNQFAGLPALAVGFRNLGNCKVQERMLLGCDVVATPEGYERVEVERYQNFSTRPTLYAVLTKDFGFGATAGGPPSSTLGLTLGFGNGLFSDDGDLGDQYNQKGTIAEGLFLGGRYVAHPTLNTSVTVLAENDGWDYNAGIIGDWRGITLGLYGTELEEGGRRDAAEGFNLYNYTKFNVSLGYSGNLIDISRGVLLRSRITELTREQQRLRTEIAARERRIRGLEDALRKAQAGELADIARRRQALEAELQAERDAIRRANERLRDLQAGRPTPPPTPPPTTPPSTPPASSTPPSTPPAR